MAKKQDKKKKDREKRVAQKKLADAAKRREIAKTEDKTTNGPRAKQVMTAGVKQKAQNQTQTSKPTVSHRRAGG